MVKSRDGVKRSYVNQNDLTALEEGGLLAEPQPQSASIC